jgi:hypothetical protein
MHWSRPNALTNAGHDVYDFHNPRPGEHGFHRSELAEAWKGWPLAEFRDALDHPIARHAFAQDMNALWSADACVLVLPGGRSSHLEAGLPAGKPAGKPVFLLLADGEPELMYRMATAICLDLDELVEQLRRCALPWDGNEWVWVYEFGWVRDPQMGNS